MHMANVFTKATRVRVLEGGDSSVSHPFASLVGTFRFLEERNGPPRTDPWFGRLRDATLSRGDPVCGRLSPWRCASARPPVPWPA